MSGQDKTERVTSEWCDIVSYHPQEYSAETLICDKPYHGISVHDEGDDTLGAKFVIGLDQLDDLGAAIARFRKLPSIEAQLTYMQEYQR